MICLQSLNFHGLPADNDMEKDTWSFKSMADDPMDFAFGSPANKKKNAFKL